MKIPQVEKFVVPLNSGSNKYKKYIAYMKDGRKIPFGDRRYEHYKDSVPVELGGSKWSHKDHLDKSRRRNYRARHAGVRVKNGDRTIDVKYSPSWFSYYFLW